MRIENGLSLVEVLIVVAMAGLLLTFAVPSFQGLQARRATDAALATLVNDFALARSEAIKRGHSVTVCPSADGSQCLSAANAAGDWEWKQGWVVFLSPSGGPSSGQSGGTTGTGASAVPGAAATSSSSASSPAPAVLRVQGPVPGIQSISSSKSELRFVASGIAVGAADHFEVVPSADASLKRLLCISIVGRAYLADAGSSKCA